MQHGEKKQNLMIFEQIYFNQTIIKTNNQAVIQLKI